MNSAFTLGRDRPIGKVRANDQAKVIYASTESEQRDNLERFKRRLAKAVLDAKVDRAVELAERVAARKRALPRLEGPDTTLLPSVGQAAAQMRRDYEANMERRCAESAAAYAARNPHSKEGR